MQEVYRVHVTDIAYAYEGTNSYTITDKKAFEALSATDTLSKVKYPEEFEDDGVSEWLYSLNLEDDLVYPYAVLGEAWLWSNC